MTKHFMPPAPLAALMASKPPAGVTGGVRADAGDLPAVLTAIRSEVARISDNAMNKIEALETRQIDFEQSHAGGFGRRSDGASSSWGGQVVNSEAFLAAQANPDGKHRFKIQQAITTGVSSGGALIPRDARTDPTEIARRRMTVRDLLNPGRTTSGLVEFARQTTRTNNAAMVSEGTTKPESVYAWERAEAPVRTLAHWVPVSRQAMDDASQLQSVLDGELRYGLDLIEEAQLLAGDGTGENLEGLIGAAVAFSAPFQDTGDTDIDTILQAKAQLAAPGSEIPANGVILNSLDWERMTGMKDGDNRYLGAGPFGNTPEVLWRLPVVASNSMPEGEFLVGDFRRAATIYDRMEIEVLISSEHADFFIKNMLAVRAEKRLALAITMPAAMVHGTLSSAVSG
ncbi:phage major capsid protein [Aurantimonas litoralis]|nr:phage major capsid protein [Aurantimonas litoralis]